MSNGSSFLTNCQHAAVSRTTRALVAVTMANELGNKEKTVFKYTPIEKPITTTREKVLHEFQYVFSPDTREITALDACAVDSGLDTPSFYVLPRHMKELAIQVSRTPDWSTRYLEDMDGVDRTEYRSLCKQYNPPINGPISYDMVRRMLQRLINVANNHDDGDLGKKIDELIGDFVDQVNRTNLLYSKLDGLLKKVDGQLVRVWDDALGTLRKDIAREESLMPSRKRRREEDSD